MHCRWYPSMPCSRSPEGGVLSQHALQVVSQHALQQVSRGVPAPGGCLLLGGGGVPTPREWPSGLVAFCDVGSWIGGLLIDNNAVTPECGLTIHFGGNSIVFNENSILLVLLSDALLFWPSGVILGLLARSQDYGLLDKALLRAWVISQLTCCESIRINERLNIHPTGTGMFYVMPNMSYSQQNKLNFVRNYNIK